MARMMKNGASRRRTMDGQGTASQDSQGADLEQAMHDFEVLVDNQRRSFDSQAAALTKALEAQLKLITNAIRSQQRATQEGLRQMEKVATEHLNHVQQAETKHAQSMSHHLELIESAERERRKALELYEELTGDQGKQVKWMFQQKENATAKAEAAQEQMSQELADLRRRHSDAVKENQQGVSELTARFERHTRRLGEQAAAATGEANQLRAKVEELSRELSTALAVNERLVGHVQKAEHALEATLVPLREEVDTARHRIKSLEEELASTKQALQLGLPPLPKR